MDPTWSCVPTWIPCSPVPCAMLQQPCHGPVPAAARLSMAGGPHHTAYSPTSPQALSTPQAAQAACITAPASVLPQLDAANSTQELRQDRREQQERLRAFLSEQLLSADRDRATHAPWPEAPTRELRVSGSGLCEGGLAEGLFRRMGSTPAAAALLSLVCPITKVCATCVVRG